MGDAVAVAFANIDRRLADTNSLSKERLGFIAALGVFAFAFLSRTRSLDQTALGLQHGIYEKHFTELNNENARVKEAQSESVSVDKFEGHEKSQNQFEREVRESMKLNSGTREGIGTTLKVIAASLATLLVLVGLFTAYQASRNQANRVPVATQTVTTPTKGTP